ncbi:MAG TPA: DNA/RNA non-specific endonuclease [Aquabacterium sp.]|nr:DNA/RNA non-specific endonuclease [Aquabacterium sp.]
MAIERVLGTANFVDAPPTPEAGVAARPVARIVEAAEDGFEPQGFGTGFLVAPDVLMTNNHVLGSFEDVPFAAANFGYVRLNGRVSRGTVHPFSLDPDEFFTDEALDFTLVGLQRDPGFGFHPLIGTVGKILLGQQISIIQHPNGGVRRYAVDNSTLLDLLPDFLHYTTDTEPGSSGSPNFNDHWEVVGLHHQGVPRMKNGVIMAKGDRPWNPQTMQDSDIDWVANEGVRVSRIIDRLQAVRRDQPRLARLIDRVLAQSAEGPAERFASIGPTGASIANSPSGETMSATTIHIHAPTTIYTSSGTASERATTPLQPVPTLAPRLPSLDAPEGVSIDPNYAGRAGYSATFLSGGHTVALPTIPAAMRGAIAPLKDGDATGVLKYHHFSVVMHAERRLAIYTAVNIDGKKGKRPARESDKWFFDPRMDRKYQVGEDLYKANPLDRGHLVRRLDPAWGTTKVAKIANDDTFHFTNCSPQHANLNQKIWVDLEDYLLDHAQEDDVRLTVFTGPVFKDEDPTYRGVQLPRRFWKVAVMRDTQGHLLAAGFVQSQRRMITGLKEADFLRQEMRTDQFKVSQIEALTGLLFNIDPSADALHGEPDVPIPETGGLIGRPLNELEDIVLRRPALQPAGK